ncbi:putative sugar nucleotidyl transferase [Rhodohalobacter halophilus]|uniref:putative sugar nucleotidyl transferase n=1 Tax=Rhodohalobacter halophilus TaxID=1812810 RepID=UPI00083FC3F8|nr:putative sugar nucleotidyl transferase [Rhodohalobacter halophilus]
MKLQYSFFEDHCLENFHPLTLTRPVYDLRVGIYTLAEKWAFVLGIPESVPLCGPTRQHLRGVFDPPSIHKDHDAVLWINPRFLPNVHLKEQIDELEISQGLTSGSVLVAALVSTEMHKEWCKNGIDEESITTQQISSEGSVILKNIWELFQINGSEIREDIRRSGKIAYGDEKIYPNTLFVKPEQIYIDEDAVIEPGAMLIAEKGPIYIGKNAQIMANSVVRGPSSIGEKSVVKMGAKIYEDTTIGPVCKVGGEISNVIFHSYSNKAHDGYAGNSVFGQWVNLGADTNTSNLKNNYGTVKVTEWTSGKEIDSGQQFIGTIMGDHSKTGINSMLNTGTLCGVCCNLFSDGYPPKFIPSFSWVSGQNIVPYHFEKAIDAMEKMMDRRNVKLTPSYKKMMQALFDSTSF